MHILLTRPQQQGAHTAAVLRARGHRVLHAPLLRIDIDADAELGAGPWSAVLMTSANAARAISAHRRRAEVLALPAMVVGERSREAAIAAGFATVESADGGVEELTRHVVARISPDQPLLYLAGEDRAGDLAGALRASGYRVATAIVYRTVAVSDAPHAVLAAFKTNDLDAVLHYSRRSSDVFLQLMREASCLVNVLKCKHFCLSAQVAAPLIAAKAPVLIAARPNEAALLDLVGMA